jgi:Fe-Mn family superoxide dismutase
MNIMVTSKSFTLPALPYDDNALEPTISARTIGIHYRKHHKAYVDKLNELRRAPNMRT